MIFLRSVLLVWLFGTAGQLPSVPSESVCLQSLAAGADAAAGEICLGEEASRLAGVAPKDSNERNRQLAAAARHYARAVDLSSKVEIKARVLDLLAQSYDSEHLKDPNKGEQALRELIRLVPSDLMPVYRLAKSLEERGLIEAAEDTFLAARHQQPEVVEPYRMLAQFYARRVTALHKDELRKERRTDSGPGERDGMGSIALAIRSRRRHDWTCRDTLPKHRPPVSKVQSLPKSSSTCLAT